MLQEFLGVAEFDMVVFPGHELKDWVSYWHATFGYQGQKNFDQTESPL